MPRLRESKDDLEQVRKNILNLLTKFKPESIRKNSFWNEYKAEFQDLPALDNLPSTVKKRGDIFKLCDFCEIETWEDGFEYCTLKVAQRPAKKKEAASTSSAKPQATSVKTCPTKTDPQKAQVEAKGGNSKPKKKVANTAHPYLSNFDFPELGSEPAKQEDNMAMRGGRNQRGVNNFHPYDFNPVVHVGQPQQYGASALSSAPNFYDQFYSPVNQNAAAYVSASPSQARASSSSYSSRTPTNRNERQSQLGSSSRGGTHVSRDQLDLVAKEAIERLAEAKEYVSVERVEKLILQQLQVKRVADLSIYGVRNVEHISAVNELARMQAKVNAYVQAFMRVRSVGTLHELQIDLENLCCKKGDDFDSLKIGPLQCQPIVYDYFKFPEKNPIPTITTCDVLDMLRDWLSKNNLWGSRELSLEEFMEHMQEAKGLDTPYELGVRIRSLILLIQVLKRSQSECGRAAKDILKNEREKFKDEVVRAFSNLSRAIVQKDPGTQCTIRQIYAQESAVDVVIAIFDKFKLFHSQLAVTAGTHSANLLTKSERRQINRLDDVFLQFKSVLTNMELGCIIFRLAVCASKHEIHEQLWERVFQYFQPRIPKNAAAAGKRRHIVYDSDGEPIEQDEEEGDDEAYEEDEGDQRPLPSKGEIEEGLLKYLERCVMSKALTLESLHRIENKILEDLDFDHFAGLGHGTFLECLTTIPRIKKFLEESGGMTLGGTSHSGAGKGGDSVYHTSQHHLLDFIRQTAITEESQIALLEEAVCGHYHVTDVKNLGHGSAQHLMNVNAKNHHRQAKENNVLYEGALCAKSRGLSVRNESKVGVLGHQTKSKALACLQNCPLLEDLEEWSHWELVFKPDFGDLKEFIQKHGKLHSMPINENGVKYTMNTHIVALETKPGTLVKLTPNTSPEKFEEATNNGDVKSTCAHLLSLLIMNKGIENLPMPLLGNYMKAALIKMQAQSETDGNQRTQVNGMCNFVVECLTLLPFTTCQAVSNKIFIEPLSQVVGAAKSKEVLLHSASTHSQLSRLQILGCALGINEWAKSFEKRTQPAAEYLEKQEVPMEFAALGEENNAIEIEDEDSSEEEDMDEETGSSEDPLVTPLVEKTARKTDHSEPNAISYENEPDVVIVEKNKDDDIADDVTGSDAVKSDDVTKVKDMKAPSSVSHDMVAKYGADVDSHFALIEQIRRNKFGVNFEMSEEFRALFESQSEMMGRGLERLSKDLYSKDTHFVLELIQNADDNDYTGMQTDGLTVAVGSPKPSVLFRVEKDRISVFNNEVGFQEKNIRAVCDVGRSTKGKHKFGYIGQKGIGFKSVFRVTDRPEIHSNGFHICFDVHSGPTGYILPHWIGEEPKFCDLEPENETKEISKAKKRGKAKNTKESADWTTNIILPLKETAKEQGQLSSLAARFHDVHPSLLLFLHRLRNISVINEVEDYSENIQRKDLPNGLVEISHSAGKDRWLVIKHILDASKISEQAKSGVEVESTEIALAFLLQDKMQGSTQIQPEKQPVFAFLPLRSYGFRFVIQGDFDVPSSREDVDRDSVWNQWLIGHVHQLFVQALDAFKAQPGVNEVEAVCKFLQYLPLEDEILDFFRPVATKILHQIRAKPCLPAQPVKGKAIQWKMPSKLVVCKDPLVREIVKSDLLQQQLSLDYLHPEVINKLNSSLISTLGVQALSTQHLLDLGKTTIAELVDQQTASQDASSKKLEFIAKWLTCIYRSIDDIQPDESILTQLKELPIMPLASTNMVKLSEKVVFFPITDERKNAKKQKNNRLMRHLATDLDTLDPQLFTCLDDVASSQVHKLLDILGVKKITPYEVINNHIMPVLKSDAIRQKNREMLFAYLVYIKEELDSQPSLISIEELKKYAIVLTNQGPRNPATHAVHFSTVYGNAIDLPRLLPGCDWVMVDACYLQGSQGKHDILGWYNFLTKLGVLDFISVKTSETIIRREDLDDTPWASIKDLLPVHDQYKIMDCVSLELNQLLTENGQPNTYFQQMRSLYQLLDINFDSMYKQHTMAKILSLEGTFLKEVESTFAMFLKSMPWLPAVIQKPGSIEQDEIFDTRIANDLYVKEDRIVHLLDRHVPYLACDVSVKSSFSTFLGIQLSIKPLTVKEKLIEWCSEKPDEEDGLIEEETNDVEFVASLGHMKRVYRFLQENLTPKEFQDLAMEYPILFHTEHIPENSIQYVKGIFVNYKQVWWWDPSGLFKKYEQTITSLQFSKLNKKTLRKLYAEPEFKDILRLCRVPVCPSVHEYALLLAEISSVVTLVKEPLSDVLQLFEILGKRIFHTDDGTQQIEELVKMEINNLKPIFKENAVIPTKANRWVSLLEKPMIADDRQMEKMWASKLGVHFVNFGGKMGKRNPEVEKLITDLLRALNVSMLSQQVNMETSIEMYEPCPQLQYYMHRVVPYLQKFVMCEHAHVYDDLKETGIKAKLAIMRFAQVEKLELVYSLKNFPGMDPFVKTEKCRIVKEEDFYVLKDLVRSFHDINHEIAKFFSVGDNLCQKEIRDILTEINPLVEDENNEQLEEYLQGQNVTELPEYEEKWEVLKPINWPPAPEPVMMPPMYGHEQDMYAEQMYEEGPSQEESRETEKREPSSGMKAWPPTAPSGYIHNKPANRENKQTSWPPPAPPQHSNYRDLPESMRNLPPRLQNAQPNEQPNTGDTHSDNLTDMEDDNTSQNQVKYQPGTLPGTPIRPGTGLVPGSPQHPGTSMDQTAPGAPHQYPGFVAPQAAHASGYNASNQHQGTDLESYTTARNTNPGYSRSESQVEMEYIDDNEVQRVQVGDNWCGGNQVGPAGDNAGPSHIDSQGQRPGAKRPRVDSGSEERRHGQYQESRSNKPVIFYGNPIWTETGTEEARRETQYEELACSKDLALPDIADLSENTPPLEVAIWGEKLVHSYLMQLQQDPESDILEVKWINEENETGLPYDFAIHVRDPQNLETVEVFIEVKSTMSDKKAFFEISSQQFRFAQDTQDNFHLYRVFNAGDCHSARITKLVNVANLLDKKQVRLCMVV